MTMTEMVTVVMIMRLMFARTLQSVKHFHMLPHLNYTQPYNTVINRTDILIFANEKCISERKGPAHC